MEFLQFLEQTAIATFVRESSSYLAFPTFLFLHTLGLSLVVGANTVVAVRVLGLASGIPPQPLVRLFPFAWVGFVITILSGAGLAIAKASSMLVNPILLVKLVMIGFAATCMRMLEKRFFRSPEGVKNLEAGQGKTLAAALLVLWLFVTIAGRLIAYSGTIFGM